MKIAIITVLMGVVLIGVGFLILDRPTDEGRPITNESSTTIAEEQPEETFAAQESGEVEKATLVFDSFPPVSRKVEAAIADAAIFAMNEDHELARKAIFRAVALKGNAEPLHDFVNHWYTEIGYEEIGLPLFIIAQRMGARWADSLVRVMSREFDKEDLERNEEKVAQMEAEYQEIQSEVTGDRS